MRILIDVDMSLRLPGLHVGVRRSPLSRPEDVLNVARKAREAGLGVSGIMGYEAQVAGMPDKSLHRSFLNPVKWALKRASIRHVAALRYDTVNLLRSEGFEMEVVNAGGTGSLTSSSREEVVTEVTAGSAFYSPALFDFYRQFRYRPAMFFALQAVRKAAPGIAVCQGGGFVASGEVSPDKLPVPSHPPGLRLLGHEACGEVQTPVAFSGKYPVRTGDTVYFRHAKAGELCEHFNFILLVEGERIVRRVKTYRGMGKNFL